MSAGRFCRPPGAAPRKTLNPRYINVCLGKIKSPPFGTRLVLRQTAREVSDRKFFWGQKNSKNETTLARHSTDNRKMEFASRPATADRRKKMPRADRLDRHAVEKCGIRGGVTLIPSARSRQDPAGPGHFLKRNARAFRFLCGRGRNVECSPRICRKRKFSLHCKSSRPCSSTVRAADS
jgi:hypothetical protein